MNDFWVIERIDQGRGFVAPAGQRSSYTHDVREARKFKNREAAERERCPDNEIVRNLIDVLRCEETA